ncbi:MAG: lytic murein transglycosylase B [Gammaproteobacteria bacterium]|nr:lytic murein transglycosylase B [Gammaproteobacteria bacterium]
MNPQPRLSRLPGIALMMLCSMLTLPASQAITPTEYPALGTLVGELVNEQGFEQQALLELFKQVELRPEINEAMARPAEKAMAWEEYRDLFVTPQRITQGLAFWRQHADTLAKAEQQYGVPAALVVAIIGVETRYGTHAGRHQVMASLSTLAFAGAPRRQPFFTAELRAFLLLTQAENIDPLSIKGSYAGAMGIPQFIPSSYREYAVDFDGDGQRDLWNNPADAIGSVANYFRQHQWQTGQPVLHPALADADTDADLSLLEKGVKPHTPLADFPAAGYQLQGVEPEQRAAPAALIKLETVEGTTYYATRQNFYVITRYNRAIFYAMAVHQLSEALDRGRHSALQRP